MCYHVTVDTACQQSQILFCSVLFCPVLSTVLSCPVLFCPVLSCPLSCHVLSCPVLFCSVLLSYLLLPSSVISSTGWPQYRLAETLTHVLAFQITERQQLYVHSLPHCCSRKAISVLYVVFFFWGGGLISRRLNFICRHFGTLCHLHRSVFICEDGTDAGESPKKKEYKYYIF